MKKCIYCGTIHKDDVETCCGFSEFEPIVEEEILEKDNEIEIAEEQKEEFEEIAQPAAHELLAELVENIDLDEVEIIEPPLPDWIINIPYEDVREDAEKRYLIEHPILKNRIKKYLGL